MNDDYLNYGNPCEEDEREYECRECGNPVEEDGQYCSSNCWEAGER